ncbi:MAG: DUF4386 domain-containing protein [Proteobacteria bacterium]|nr:DUF4386 domain-containing protein [Pseudomonadota bacterium]
MTDLSPRKAALVAGFGYLVVFILTPYSWVESLIVFGDAATTASNIMASEFLFRMSIACWLIVLASDVVVAWALYYFFKPVNSSLALVSAWFRLLFVAIFGINMLNWVNALQLIVGAGDFAAIETDQLQAQAMLFFGAYEYGANIAFVFFGVHIAILGYLVLKAGFMPRIFGILLIVASVGYFIDSFASFLFPAYAKNEVAFWLIVAVPAILAELSLTLWLLFKGGKVQRT